jgi:ABC-type transport system involved in multi-copper enzyme maturation permease subunit
MFGPHFYYDLIRLARKRRNLFLRCGYLLVLLAAWWLVYAEETVSGHSTHFTNIINIHANLASSFARTIVIVQYVLIIVLTPIYLAGTIIEEKANRTLELLFQTTLTDREILLGKLGARMVHLMSLLLSSLPLLAIISLWGGMDVAWLTFHFAFSLLLLAFVSSISLYASVASSSYIGAIGLVYALECLSGFIFLLLVLVGLMSRILVPGTLSFLWWAGAFFLLAGCCHFYARSRTRFGRLRDLQGIKPIETAHQLPHSPTPERKIPARSREEADTMSDDALFWKEVVHEKSFVEALFNTAVLLSLIYLCWVCGVYLLAQPSSQRAPFRSPADFEGFFFTYYICMLVGVWNAFVFSATSCVAREKEQNTLDFLLVLPVERSEILFVKWIAPWVRIRPVLIAMLVLPLLAVVTKVFSVPQGVIILLLPWPTLLLVSWLGLFLSVVCRRVMHALVILHVSVFMFYTGHLLLGQSAGDMYEAYRLLLTDKDETYWYDPAAWQRVLWLIGCHQGAILLLAAIFAGLAFWCFSRKTSEVRTQVW